MALRIMAYLLLATYGILAGFYIGANEGFHLGYLDANLECSLSAHNLTHNGKRI